ncbi:secretin N-terminal domain-containing protein [Rosistilla oblonga]|uniref:secretin N-terminal domain-containing protein n=1 Tax=Rosistilla oblonga TaxID=2527990 RepID=UPI003A96BA07
MNYATSERQFASVLTNGIKLALLCLIGATTALPQRAAAQTPYAPAEAQPAARPSGGSRPQPSAKSSGPKDSKEGKPEDKEKGKEEKSDGDAKKGEEAKPPEVVMRPGEPPVPPDPKEFELRPDPDGRIRFRFRNQPWPDFLQWLSDVGGYSLDWQQMPGGYLNLITYRSYTITEARDLVNRLLLDRGYTMLLRGQVLSIVKIDKLDPSMLPRVEDEAELMDLSPYDFAKITFPLPTKLKAEALAADVKSLLSPNGKVQPLVSSNRLLVIDAVANLRDVSRLINAEHAAADSHQVPREFHIRYVRADYVADQVMILLGLDPSSRRSPNELQVEQQRLQLFMQMQQKGKDVTKFLRGDSAPEVFVTVNKRVNSVLVNAPPDVLVKIERTIEQLDVPSGSAGGSLVTGEPGETGGLVEMRRYALVSLKPESVVTALKEIGDLDPRTMLQMDADAKVIFASATVRDHEKISAIIDKLDGSGREIEVIWLKRLPADQAAVTIHNLLIGKKEEDDSSRNNYYYRRYGGGGDDDDKPDSDFRVEADIENNRLLLFANKAELEAVNNLLVKLGELPGDSGNPNTIRVQDSRGAKSTADLIRQLQQLWPATANPIRVEGELPAVEEESESAPSDDDQPADSAEQDNARTTAVPKRPRVQTAVFARPQVAQGSTGNAAQPPAGNEKTAADDAKNTGNEALPPITISIANDGRLILSSQDTAALDALEELMQRLAPPPKKHRVFYLQYALASLVKLNLDEYFEDEKSTDSSDNWMRAWMGMDFKEESKNNGLASRRPVRFIYDIDTNSILVRDATPQQMETIAELIEIYDRAPSEESISARRLKVFKLEYSDANVVAATVKDVFRDLLSSKDKEFAGGGDKEKQSSGSSRTFRIFGGNDDKDSKPTKVKASFEGALSVGVDALSNTIIVSAQEEWLPAIEEIIQYMDQNAKPDTTVVVQSLSVPMDAKSMQTLADLLRPWPGNKKPEGNQPGKQGKEKPNNKQQQPQQNATLQPNNDS